MSASQLSRLLPLPDGELKQVLDYAATLSKPEAVEHFRNLLGESPEAVDFISSFNAKRQDPKAKAASSAAATTATEPVRPWHGANPVPKTAKRSKKPKAQLHTPAPRQVTDAGPAPGTVYSKNVESDYIPRRGASPASASASGSGTPARSSPVPQQQQNFATPPPPQAPKPKPLPPSAAGHLISDMRSSSKPKPKSTPSSRSSTPAPKAKVQVQIAGGTAMHGASTALADLDDAIRALEVTTNPSLATADNAASRRCDCVAARHPLLAAAPNCLRCGKVVCVREGLGPCTFCGAPLLGPGEVQSMLRELRAERGREKQAADRQAHRKPEVSRAPAPFSKPRGVSSADADEAGSEAQAKALEHRDRLLGFQAQNARRTTVRDEAADFDVGGAVAGFGGGGGNIWATPEDRARELRRQQKVLREMEWNARPDYEKRRQVVSIDLVGGKVVRKMAAIERPASPEEDEQEERERGGGGPALEEISANRGGRGSGGGGTGGAFSRNPLLGSLIKPVFEAKGKGAQLEGRKPGAKRWRRLQDDLDNNEAVILDGGAYGGGKSDQEAPSSRADEPGCG
ncbi:zf-C2HC5-domain-containing protein [Hypoxylon rubiginosum]|uniref:Zf-C2HC5-domain-containing protein n=1 Tax=Hypoxylon rubiginosum TaxID=110542 RepID=A0ACB9ZAK5_9PEZI|nr:zf-C2HC5-domain-containing protein [Hypoxylon rubiginosum]